MRRASTLLLTALLASSGLPGAHGADGPGAAPLVVLIRHAEKAAEPADDPPLTAAGAERARALADALRDAGVTAVITTPFRRTRETAQPLVEARGLTPEVVPVGRGGMAEHAAAVAAAVRRHEGGVVLVVGHSNSLPAIVEALGGPSVGEIAESAHADLFVLQAGGRLVRGRYGAPDPVPPAESR